MIMFLFTMFTNPEERFEFYYNKYYKYECAVSNNVVHSYQAVEDILPNAFAKAYEKAKHLDEAAAKRWITRIVVNESRSYLRKLNRRKEIEYELYDDEQWDKMPGGVNPLEQLTFKEAKEAVLEEIRNLPEKIFEVMNCHYFLKMTTAEIAENLDIPIKTVYGRLAKGNKLLYDKLIERGHFNE